MSASPAAARRPLPTTSDRVPVSAATATSLAIERGQAEQSWGRLRAQLLATCASPACGRRRRLEVERVGTAWQLQRRRISLRDGDGGRCRVVVADDEELLREVIGVIVSREPDVTVVGEADGAWSAVGVVGAEQPDVLVLDYELGDAESSAVIAYIRMLSPRTRVLLHSARSDIEQLGRHMGVDGVVSKSRSIQELPASLRLLTALQRSATAQR